jgi:hypothetical protein
MDTHITRETDCRMDRLKKHKRQETLRLREARKMNKMGHELNDNVANVPPRVANVPPGVANVPPRVANVPPGVANVNSNINLTCNKCDKKFSTIHWKNKHEKTCYGCGELECPHCHKEFNDRRRKSKHIKNICGKKLMDLQNNIECNVINGNVAGDVNITNTTNITNQFIIRDFLDEDFSHLKNDPTKIKALMDEIASGKIDGVVKIMFFDKDHQENQTIQYSNLKSDYMKVSKDGYFQAKIAKKVIELIRNHTKQVIRNILDGIQKEKESCDDDKILKKMDKLYSYIEKRLDKYVDKTEVDESELNIDKYDKSKEKVNAFKTKNDKNMKETVYNETHMLPEEIKKLGKGGNRIPLKSVED